MAESNEYSSTLQRIMIIATLGGLLFGYDTGVVNGALPFMAAPDQLNLDPLQEGMVVSALLVGAAVGSFCGGKLADYQGRKKNIIWLSIIFFASTLGCSLAPSFHVMLVSRFVLGLAVGGASVTVPAYLAEIYSTFDERLAFRIRQKSFRDNDMETDTFALAVLVQRNLNVTVLDDNELSD